MKTKTRLFLIATLLFLGLLSFAFRPIPVPSTESDCLVAEGIVSNITYEGVNDVKFELEGTDKVFYINRGLERGLDLKELQTSLAGQEVRIFYPNYWTPLDPTNSTRHVSKLEYNGKSIFSEI